MCVMKIIFTSMYRSEEYDEYEDLYRDDPEDNYVDEYPYDRGDTLSEFPLHRTFSPLLRRQTQPEQEQAQAAGCHQRKSGR